MKKEIIYSFLITILFILMIIFPSINGINIENISNDKNLNTGLYEEGPLGEWPDFTPIGYITAPHPDNPNYQTHLYGDWGGIVGEEFIFLQDGMIKLLYHSYHETYLTEREHDYDVIDNWALGYDPVTKIKLTPLVKPGGSIPGPAYLHTDTPGYIKHPVTGEHLIYNTVRPGTKDDNPEWVGIPGTESAIQVATSINPPSMGIPFIQSYENMLIAEYWWEKGWNQEGEIKGGLSEPTPVWIPELGKVRLFYRGLNGAVGTYWAWRISYADSVDGKTNWVKKGVATFDPSVPGNPAYEIWQQTGFRGSWQAHVTGDPIANGVHMVCTVSNQNYAGGGRISYFWSPDWGDTWIAHPDNPILIPGTHPDGVPSTGFQRTPTLVIDEEYNRYILAYNAGHDITEKWKRRTHLAFASRPIINIPPNADFNYSESPTNNNIIEFTDLSTDIDGEIVYWHWDFGDGTISLEQNPIHEYDEVDNYLVNLTVEDDFGVSDSVEKNILVGNRPPYTPNKPIGLTEGGINLTYSYHSSTIDPNDDNVKYGWDWNNDDIVDEWTNFYLSGETVTIWHSWDSVGIYSVKVKSKDVYDAESDFSTPLIVYINDSINNPPIPPQINGPSSGGSGNYYDYSFVTTDPESDDIFYYVEWGDGDIEEWIGPFGSGEQIILNHSWNVENKYIIRVKAKDSHGVESDWSTFEISIPKSKDYLNILFNWFFELLIRYFSIFDIIL